MDSGRGEGGGKKSAWVSKMKGNGDLERGFGHGRQTLSAMRKTNQLGIVALMVNAPQLGMPGYVNTSLSKPPHVFNNLSIIIGDVLVAYSVRLVAPQDYW